MFSNIEKIKTYIVILLLAGCGTLVGNPEGEDATQHQPSEAAGGPGSQIVTFKIADAPIDDAASVFVTVKSIAIKPENGDWEEVPLLIEQEIDLLKYQDGDSLAFAKTEPVEAGTYTNTRLILSDVVLPRIVLIDGSEKKMKFESAGLTVELEKSFTVAVGQPVEITFDFDLRKSLQTEGEGDSKEYTLNPSLRMLKAGEFGEITGEALEGKVVCVYLFDGVMDDDDSCDGAVNSAKVKDGKYTLPYMPEGSYKVRVFDDLGAVKHLEAEGVEHKVVPKTAKKDDKKINQLGTKVDAKIDDVKDATKEKDNKTKESPAGDDPKTTKKKTKGYKNKN